MGLGRAFLLLLLLLVLLTLLLLGRGGVCGGRWSSSASPRGAGPGQSLPALRVLGHAAGAARGCHGAGWRLQRGGDALRPPGAPAPPAQGAAPCQGALRQLPGGLGGHGTHRGTPNGTPNVTPNVTPDGTPNRNLNGNSNGKPNGNPNVTPNGTLSGIPHGTPKGTPSGIPNGTPNITPSCLGEVGEGVREGGNCPHPTPPLPSRRFGG